MFYPESFKISTPADREILIERDFAAPRSLVWDCFTKPELVRQWLLGPDGWTMPVCEIDARPGGSYRYVWRKAGVPDMGMGGTFQEVSWPGRLVATEKFDEAWYPGEALNTTEFTVAGPRTHVAIRVRYESREARDSAKRSGMERGMAAGYDRLERLLPSVGPWETLEAAPRPAAVIRLKIPRAEMPHVMPEAIQELAAVLARQGIAPAGPLFAHHLTLSDESFDFVTGFPVEAPVRPEGRVQPGTQPGGRIARGIHTGAYEELFAAWNRFRAWQRQNGVIGRGDIWEVYAVGPESTSDPAQWRTELCVPLAE